VVDPTAVVIYIYLYVYIEYYRYKYITYRVPHTILYGVTDRLIG
jgi:hypothetical protein